MGSIRKRIGRNTYKVRLERIAEGRAETFARQYVKHWDEVRAMVEAGFPKEHAEKNAMSYKSHPSTKKRIEEALEDIKEQHLVEVKEVVEGLRGVIRAAMLESKFADVNRALELLGKYVGMFSDKSEHKFDFNNPFESGKTPEAQEADIRRFAQIAGPLLQSQANDILLKDQFANGEDAKPGAA